MTNKIATSFHQRKIHAYAASFGDDLAYDLIKANTSKNDVILDPFAGSGTSLLQARRTGRSGIGIDVDPVACLISRVVTTSYKSSELDSLETKVNEFLSSIDNYLPDVSNQELIFAPGQQFSFNGTTATIPKTEGIEFWFAPVQRAILSALVELIRTIKDRRLKYIVELAVSSAIVRKWPNTLTQARDIDHSRPHRVIRDDLTLKSQADIFRKVFKRTLNILRELNTDIDDTTGTFKVIQGRAEAILARVKRKSVDYILTSPPYFNAIDYQRAHKFSQWWLWPEKGALTNEMYLGLRHGRNNLDVVARCKEIIPDHMKQFEKLEAISAALHIALCRYVVESEIIIEGLLSVLKPGKYMTVVLANNVVRGVAIPVVELFSSLLRKAGFKKVHTEERRISIHRRRYPYGITGFQGLMDSEFLISAKRTMKHRNSRVK